MTARKFPRRRPSRGSGTLILALGALLVFVAWVAVYERQAQPPVTPSTVVPARAHVRAGFEPADPADLARRASKSTPEADPGGRVAEKTGTSPQSTESSAAANGAVNSVATVGGATDRYAVVMLTATAVRAFTFDFDRTTRDSACRATSAAFWSCLRPQMVSPDTDRLAARSVEKSSEAVSAMIDQVKRAEPLVPERLYVVGSSELAQEVDIGVLRDRLQQTLELVNPVRMLSQDEATTDTFEGVLSMSRESARCALESCDLIDFGSAETTFVHRDDERTGMRITAQRLPVGTKISRRQIESTGQTDPGFRRAANYWRTTVLAPELGRLNDGQGLATERRRVYLVGGIAWAAANFAAPDDTSPFVGLPPRSIDALLNRTDGAGLCSALDRDGFKETRRVCDVYADKDLIVGLEILKAVADQRHWGPADEAARFVRNSIYALPLGYLARQLATHGQ